MGLFGILSQSLAYENVEKQSTVIINDILNENANFTNQVNSIYPLIESYCQNNSEYVFSFEGKTIEVSCEKVLAGKDAVIEEGLKSWIKDIYYKDYDCKFIECIKEQSISEFAPFFLVSEKAYLFWTFAFRIFLAISILLAVAIFFLAKKSNMPIIVGALLILSSIPFLKLDALLALFSDKMLFRLLSVFFSQSLSVSVKMLIIGIAFVLLGVILKVFKIGFFISKVFTKIKELKNKPKEKAEKPMPSEKAEKGMPKKNAKKQKRNNF